MTGNSDPTPMPVYDSAAASVGVLDSLRTVLNSGPLVRILVRRETTMRYRRSALGVLWSMLTPVSTILVMWVVFRSVFAVADLGVPYALYLASGVLIVSVLQQGVNSLGASLHVYEPLMTKARLPVEVLATAIAGGIVVQVTIMFAVVVALQWAIGVSFSITSPVAAGVLALTVLFCAGVGLLVASAAVRLGDALHVANSALYLVGFLTPTFFPLEAIEQPARSIIDANPMTGYLQLFRGCLYENTLASTTDWVWAVGLAVSTFVSGVSVYGRAARRAVVR